MDLEVKPKYFEQIENFDKNFHHVIAQRAFSGTLKLYTILAK